MLVGEVVSQGEIRTELLKARLALGAGAVGIDHAADCGEVAGLEPGDGGADLGDAAHNLMARNAGVNGGHRVLPLVANLVEIGVTNAAEQDFDLHVVFGGIAPRDRGRRQRRCCTRSRICFCVVHALTFHTPSPGLDL